MGRNPGSILYEQVPYGTTESLKNKIDALKKEIEVLKEENKTLKEEKIIQK